MYSFDQYQKDALKNAVFPPQNWNSYLPMNLASEAGEVAGKFAKYFRGDGPINEEAVLLEVGDCLWHLAVLSHYMGTSLEEVAQMNTKKLNSRTARGVTRGSGDYR